MIVPTNGLIVIPIQRGEDRLELQIEGVFDATTVDMVKKPFEDAAAYKYVEVSLARLSSISGIGLRQLLILQKQIKQHDGEMTVTRVPPAVMTVIEQAGFDRILTIL